MRSVRLVFEERLRKDTFDGSNLTGFTLKFVFAGELRSTAAVNQWSQEISMLGTTPAAADLLASAADTGTTLQITWGVLLLRLERFNKIATDIAAVIGVHVFASLIHHLHLVDPSVCVDGLVCYISCHRSLSVPHNSCYR